MIIERSMNDSFLSNSYVVGDRPGGNAVLIDSGGPPEPILKAIEDHELTVSHLLLTHHHEDHIAHNDLMVERFGCKVYGHPDEAALVGGVDQEIGDGDEIVSGQLRIRALHTPGHTSGMLAFVINDECVFTGDTLFYRTVGGTMAPGHATFADLKHSIMDVLMALPEEIKAYPGHTDSTTIGDEWQNNPFIRIWRGLDESSEKRCTAFGRPATLVLRAPDYDGGTKCWVRFDEGNADDVVPGSQVIADGE